MGDYFTSLEIPKDTPADKPETKDITVEGEILSEVAYLIPPGWQAIPRWALFYGIKQIYPDPEAEWVTGAGLYRSVPLRWPMPESKVKLTVKGYNVDDTYPHTLHVWLLTAPEEEARPWKVIADFVAILKRLMGLRG